MLRLHFSNRMEGLLEALAKDVAAFRFAAPLGDWEPVHLVLPNAGVKQFVGRELARAFRVLVNVETSFLEGFWRRFLQGEGGRIRLLDRVALQGALLALLQDPAVLADPDLAPVRSYLDGPARDLKAHQFAAELARVFEGYLLTRPDWAPRWERGEAAAAAAAPQDEAWQRALWRRLRRALRRADANALTFPEFLRDPRFGQLPFPKQVFLLGLGNVAVAHLRAFARLGEVATVDLYALSPSKEAWDAFPDELAGAAAGEDPFNLESRGGLALRRWGRPVREQVRLLSEQAGWRQDGAFPAPEQDHLLARLQADLLDPAGSETLLAGAAADGSLAIHACPSPRREAEVVAGLVWDFLAEHPGATFSDVAVMLPEGVKSEYLDPLRLAFAGTHRIPWTLADEGPRQVQELAEAAGLLLRLGLTDLNRAEVLRVLGHPALRERWAELPLEALPEVCAQCAMIARLDAAETAGTALVGGLWTWNRGFQRAALGRFAGGDLVYTAARGEALPAAETDPAHADLLHLLGALLADARALAGLRLPPSAWVRHLQHYLQAYLGPAEGEDDEPRLRGMDVLNRAVARLGELELANLAPPRLGLAEVAAFLDEAFQRLLGEALGGLGKGVVVATHAALRGVPFQALFLMGMGEGVFPGTEARDPLDLRSGQRRAGDLGRRDQDRTLFLEALLSARRRLTFSYVCRDPLTRVALQPSPLLLDLRDVLAPALEGRAWEQIWREHPVHRHDLGYFPDLGGVDRLPRNHHPEARAEAEALALGAAARAAAGGRTGLPLNPRDWKPDPATAAALGARVHDGGPLGPALAAPAELRITLAQLRRWLECPRQGGAAIRLGLRGEDREDPALVAVEPWQTAFLDRRGLERELFWASLAGDAPLEERVARGFRQAVEAGAAPAGPPGLGERASLLARIEARRTLAGPMADLHAVRFGADRSGRLRHPFPIVPAEAVPLTVVVDGRPLQVRLEGQTEPLAGPDRHSVLLSDRPPPPQAHGRPDLKDRRELLRAWLDQLALAAAGLKTGPHAARVLATPPRGRPGSWWADLPDLDGDGARRILGGWIQEALQDRAGWAMPVEGVLATLDARRDGDPDATLEGWAEDFLDDAHATVAANYGPLPRIALSGLDPHWEAKARARFGAFLDWSARGRRP